MLAFATIQIGFGVQLIQLMDWSTTWTATLVALGMSAGYAMFLAVTLLAAEGNDVITTLQLAEGGFTQSQMAGWCFIMVLLNGLMAYFAGRFTLRWHKTYKVLALLKVNDMP